MARVAVVSRGRSEWTERVREILSRRALQPGAAISELELSRQLGVSRTPIRAALQALVAEGLLSLEPGRGFSVTRAFQPSPIAASGEAARLPAEAQLLMQAIARDRLDGTLADTFLESDLVRRYGVSRFAVGQVLRYMGEIGVVERRAGYGWVFLTAIVDDTASAAAMRFRLLVEPAGLLEPGFALDPAWAEQMGARHRAALEADPAAFSSVAFFEMNAAFHEGLARASGNPYILMAVQQQNRLRRFLNYNWTYGHARVLASLREHLEILAQLQADDRDWAAQLMRRHILTAEREPAGHAEESG